MTTNIATTKKQSARLLQCGVDPKTADITISKLRDILEDVASSQFEPRRLNDATIDEIINRVKESI